MAQHVQQQPTQKEQHHPRCLAAPFEALRDALLQLQLLKQLQASHLTSVCHWQQQLQRRRQQLQLQLQLLWHLHSCVGQQDQVMQLLLVQQHHPRLQTLAARKHRRQAWPVLRRRAYPCALAGQQLGAWQAESDGTVHAAALMVRRGPRLLLTRAAKQPARGFGTCSNAV
jgi:hypothetical protein